MAELRSVAGMRERSPGVRALIVENGRDPSVAAEHCTGRGSETDRELAKSVAALSAPPSEVQR